MPRLQSHRMSTKLRQVLSHGPREPKRLTGELLLAMRRGELFEAADPTVEKLFVEADPARGWRELEDCLDEAWRNACALNLPLSEDMKQCVVDNLVKVRYKQSTESTATFEKTKALKPLLDRLVEYSCSLENELERLQVRGRGLVPVSARSEMLAMLCAQHLYRVRELFENTYKGVQWPWEDFHNDLVMFIEELKASKPAAQVNVERLTRSLWNFKETVGLLEKYELKPKPKPVREATASQIRVPDQRLPVLRNWHSQTSEVPAYADAHVRWHELWGRVNVLLKYSESLQGELAVLERQGHDPVPGSADKSVMLARLCALAVHSVKRSFLSTYKDVPWEEMEYLLVKFIEERTVYATLAHAVANAKRTVDHLEYFREQLEKCKKKWTEKTLLDPEAAMRTLKTKLGEKGEDARAAVFAGEANEKLTKLREDFTLLRDWHSLKEMNETLEVTKKALTLKDEASWVAWGWLALEWALFVVGEMVKYSWTSPNLSPRWVHLVEAIAPGGVLKVMAAIRDYQAHPQGKDSSNALSGMKNKERTKLAEEFEKLKKAVHVALVKVESTVECYDCDRVDLAKSKSSDTDTSIRDEVVKKLKPAEPKDKDRDKDRNTRDEFENIKSFSDFKTNYSYFWFISVKFAKKHMPKAVPSVLRLLLYRSMEHTESLYAELQEVTPSLSSPLETLRDALTAAAAAPEGQLRDFAIKGALRGLASYWHEHDQVVPTAVPFSPALFGHQLRNYLNHLDEVFCAPLELCALYHLLDDKLIPLEHGARPRPRDPQQSHWCKSHQKIYHEENYHQKSARAENERLLHLVKLKSDMFRCASEVDLEELQDLVKEDGADVSARDCQDRTLLHAAAQGGQAHVVRWLLGLGAEAVDPLAGDWRGHTALHMARTAAVAETLLDANKTANSDRQQSGAWTPLHAAAASGRAEVVAVLLRDRDPRALDAVDHNGLTPLHCAARYGHDQVVRLLLGAGARYQANAHGDTPLVRAARSGSAPTVRLLLGAAPPPADEDCWRAAESAARHGHKDACNELLGELDDRNLLEWGPHEPKGLLFCAGIGGSSAITRRLLELSPDALSEKLNDVGDTVLHAAAGAGQTHLVRTLLTRTLKADPLRETTAGWTALDCAAKCGSVDTINALWQIINRIMKKRIKHKRINDDKAEEKKKAALRQALCQAAVFGKLEAVKQLLQHRAEVDAVDKKGRRPLESAVSSGHIEVVRCLLRKGADRTLGEIPPLNVAAMMGRLGVVKVLVEESGADKVSTSKLDSKLQKRIAKLIRKTGQWKQRLPWLQQVDYQKYTALHAAVAVGALLIVKYLLNQEEELLKKIAKFNPFQNEDLTVYVRARTVYARDTERHTALQLGASMRCAPRLAQALLKRMGDSTWMEVGGKAEDEDRKEWRDVRTMAVEALQLAARHPDSGRLVRALCEWTSSKGGDLLGAGGLQDIRSRAVAALCSGLACQAPTAAPSRRDSALVYWRSVVGLIRWHLAAPPLNLASLQRRAALAIRRCLELGPRGEMALQLLCLWVRDLSEDDVPPSKVLLMIGEAMDIARDRDSSDVIGAFNLSKINFKMIKHPNGRPV